MSPARPGGSTERGGRNIPPAPDTRPGGTERITVALIPRVVDDLQSLQDRLGLSKTDITNRAISLYEFIDTQLHDGMELLIRDRKTGETQMVRIL